MPAPDISTPPSRSLSKLLRGDSKNESTNSLGESSNSDDPNAEMGVGLRPTSSRGVGDRLADRIRRRSVDERRDSADSAKQRLSSLLPSRRNKLKRTKSSDLKAEPTPSNDTLELAGNQSESSLAQEGSGRSSLLTDDNSDHEGKPARPTLSPHASHIGYLTLSSPEINAQAATVTTANSDAIDSEQPQSASSSSIPQIIEPLDSGSKSTFPDFKSSDSFASNTGSASAEEAAAQEAAYTSHAPAVQVEAVQARSDTRPTTPQVSGRPRVNTGSLPATPPNLSETPTTFVPTPTPTDPNAEFPRRGPRKAVPTRQRSDSSSSYDSIKHRRNQSAGFPSKLSQSIPAPLTPHVEETKTPGGTLSQPPPGTGFFTNFFTAAQKTANQLGSSIAIGANQKSKGQTQLQSEGQGGEEVIPGLQSSPTFVEQGAERQPAVETLGSGDLNLGHLGIAEEPSSMTSNGGPPMQNGATQGGEANNKAEEEAAARAVSEAYEKPVITTVSGATGAHRPLSIASNDRLTLGDQTPPRPGAESESIKRSGSVRSKLSGRRRKHRGSSAATVATGSTIAAGLTATATGFQNVAASGPGHRLTGFAVASSKRNKDFHSLFRSVPDDDYLIEDYSAALQRDILLHGRLYVSEGHICFSSNILGWVTNLVISFDEVVSVEKKSTAVIFPNAIVISTLQARNTFASFVARDSTYELIIGIWKISHPNLKSSLNGVSLDNAGTGDKTEVAEPEGSDDGTDTGSEDEVYDEDADDDGGSFNDASFAPSVTGSDIGDPSLSRKPSGVPLNQGTTQANGVVAKTGPAAAKGFEGTETAVAGAAASVDFPGPPTHEPSQCSESGEHYTNMLIDTVIPAPLGKVYSMVFGPASGVFMTKFLLEDQKSRELNFPSDDKFGLDNEHKTMTFDYIKPLSGSIGPRQTKCITTNTLVSLDLEKAVSIDCSTQTPDVPSGSVFMTKTRYCLMWAPDNSTRFLSTSMVEWSGKSWLKGPIEKGTNDGQTEYAKALTAALKAAVTTKPPVKGVARKGKRKGKKEVLDADDAVTERKASVSADRQEASWGPLEPLHSILKPVISILSPFMTSQVVIAVLAVLLLYTWISSPARRNAMGLDLYSTPERLVAYEEIWRREESNLWDWLEDRVGVDNIYVPNGGIEQKERQKVLQTRKMAKKLGNERMNERQMDDAIRVTEERLEALKEAMGRKKTDTGRERAK